MLVQQKAYVLRSLFLLSFHPFYEVQFFFFFFINRIFKNDLISDCLCTLNHVAGPIHKREGRGAGKPRSGGRRPHPLASLGGREAEGMGAGPAHSARPANSSLSGRVPPIKQDPMCGEEPFQVMNENKRLHH